jgi:hypothetical protein
MKPPHPDAKYRIFARRDRTLGVEVVIPDTQPTTVTGFATAADAEAWIAVHNQRIADSKALTGAHLKWRDRKRAFLDRG